MYSTKQGLVLAFHGTDKKIVNSVISGKSSLISSNNVYDWLGHGIYFWENNPERALLFANEQKQRKKIKNPAILGAVIDLGYCFDLLDSINISILKEVYESFRKDIKTADLPENRKSNNSNDLLLRDLDCAVIEYLHSLRKSKNLRPFDSLRAVFTEGNSLYPSAGFFEKSHIQLCIRNPNCIKGLFLPRIEDKNFESV